MLVPPESALLNHEDVNQWRGSLSPEDFAYQWQHSDPRMDELQQQVAVMAENAGDNPYTNFADVEELAYRMADYPVPDWLPSTLFQPAPPRLTEDWFC
jgi:hypothetical protein